MPLDNPAMQHATGGHHGNMYLTSLPLVSVSPLQLVTAVSVDAVNVQRRHFVLVADGRLRASDKITGRGEG